MTTALATVDITGLVEYLNKGKEFASVSKLHAPLYLQDFIKGLDLASNLLAQAVEEDIKRKARLEHLEAVAYLEKASIYLQARGTKDTSEARKMYVQIDPEVAKASDAKAQTEALVTLIKNKLMILKTSHDDLKKIHWADQHMSNWSEN